MRTQRRRLRSRRFSGRVSVMLVLVAITVPLTWIFWSNSTSAQVVDPRRVRIAAQAMGLDSLQNSIVVEPAQLAGILNPGAGAKTALEQLGKALFWDQQVGSDGQACGSCHFAAGADPRTKNQLSPQLRNTDPELAATFNPTGSGNAGGANYDLVPEDFPFHRLADPLEQDLKRRQELFDTDDAAASQGVFSAQFTGTTPGQINDNGIRIADPVFNVDGVNVRRVEPRNTPTVYNAVFNFDNFWDGRAHNTFNGVSAIGPLEDFSSIWVNQGGVLLQTEINFNNSSLASQAVGPPLSIDEMSYVGRTFPDIGRKMLDGRIPLAFQQVHPDDSVLGPLALYPENGLSVTYDALIRTAFHPRFWNAPLDPATGQPARINGFSLMETNFSLFFGLAVQAYEFTLIADDTPFDRFMAGDNSALTQEQLRGLLTFIKTETPFQQVDPLFNGIDDGNCIFCHAGPTLTDAATAFGGPIEFILEAEFNGRVIREGLRSGLYDEGFANIGVRPTREDIGRGAYENDKPISRARQRILGYGFAPPLPFEVPAPNPHRVIADGAFKIPGLRNVELTGPYYHNGGQLTLGQVIDFYVRGTDFPEGNIRDLDSRMGSDLMMLEERDKSFLVQFLLSLTDERVRQETAPFDHPQIRVPNGHPGDNTGITSFTTVDGVSQADDDWLVIPAVGAGGRPAEGLPPLESFLGVDHLAP